MKASQYLAAFDSASAMLRALARYLQGKDFPSLGIRSPLQAFAGMANVLPDKAREMIYTVGGWTEAMPPEKMQEVDAEEISRWAVAQIRSAAILRP